MRSKDIVMRLLEFEATPCFQLTVELLDALIQEARVRNDTAVSEDVLRNQGAIAELKQMKKRLQSQPVRRGLDGAYAE